MRKHLIHGAAAAFGAAALTFGSISTASAAEPAHSGPASSPAAYVDYLEHSDEDGASETLKEFHSLTTSEQERFIGYLQDPALFTEFLTQSTGEAAASTDTNDTQVTALRGGDVTLEAEQTGSALAVAAKRPLPKGNHTVTRSNKIKLMGVTVMEFKIWETFYSNGHTITKVVDADGGKKNYSGVVKMSKGIAKKQLGKQSFCKKGGPCSSGNTAIASIVWEGEVVISGGTFQVDKKQTLVSNVYGTTTSTLVNV
ncbi:hypothetical protein ACFYN5_17210 [Streptomyces sp. NPDC007126]|uniref:hypothetical protein n=1 Tax=Streptomyces sp. NPDC007126 TaxID=3364774 RepID=UPI00368C024E